MSATTLQEPPPLEPEASGASPSDLLVAIAACNVALLLMVIGILEVGYTASHVGEMPTKLWVMFGATIGIGATPLFPVIRRKVAAAFANISTDRVPESRPMLPNVEKAAVFILTGLTIVSLFVVVQATGGTSESPFTPLMVGPAIFTPIMAHHIESMLVVGAVVLVAIVIAQDQIGGEPNALGVAYIVSNGSMVAIAVGLAVYRRHLGVDGYQSGMT